MIEVSRVSSQEQQAALAILFRDLDDSTRFEHIGNVLDEASLGRLCLDGLLLAKSDNRPVGCGMYMIECDKTAFVWPPVVDVENCRDLDPEPIADAILQQICREIDAGGAWIGQCLLEAERQCARNRLVRNGFEFVTNLVFMKRNLSDLRPAALKALDAIEFVEQENRLQFISVLERTFSMTLDCPELKELRTATDMLSGFEAARPVGRTHWRLYQSGSEMLGVVFINERPEEDAWEIIYMGVVPEARGQKLGRAMLLASLDDLRDCGSDTVFLAVDHRNHYAIDAYDEIGFTEIGRRGIFCRSA